MPIIGTVLTFSSAKIMSMSATSLPIHDVTTQSCSGRRSWSPEMCCTGALNSDVTMGAAADCESAFRLSRRSDRPFFIRTNAMFSRGRQATRTNWSKYLKSREHCRNVYSYLKPRQKDSSPDNNAWSDNQTQAKIRGKEEYWKLTVRTTWKNPTMPEPAFQASR